MATSVAALPVPATRLALVRGRRLLALALAAALLLGWTLVLRPQSFGGPAGYVLVSGTSMLPGLRNGDLVVVRRAQAYRRGDVVSYRVPKGDPAAGLQVIHRIVGGGHGGFDVQGDNRDLPDLWRPAQGDVVGKLWLRIPYAGYALVFFRSPAVLASLAAALVAASIVMRGRRERPETAVGWDVVVDEPPTPEPVAAAGDPVGVPERAPVALAAALACLAVAVVGWAALRRRG